ncbi:unnamed protein product [Durusdinium trenchii]|uniref:Uncharacterized protein n=1 Tax=Durusdinium trenchii TaxID=1381693 RepID=A0ABP0PY75_9DINO
MRRGKGRKAPAADDGWAVGEALNLLLPPTMEENAPMEEKHHGGEGEAEEPMVDEPMEGEEEEDMVKDEEVEAADDKDKPRPSQKREDEDHEGHDKSSTKGKKNWSWKSKGGWGRGKGKGKWHQQGHGRGAIGEGRGWSRPHWAQQKWKSQAGCRKGQGKGKYDDYGGEYCVGGYRDVSGTFFPYGQGRSRKRTPGKQSQAAQKGKSWKAQGEQDQWTYAMKAVCQLSEVAMKAIARSE